MDGYVILSNFLPESLMVAYERAYEAAELGPHGFPDCTPYMRVPALLDLCCYPPLARVLEEIAGEPMAVHLNLSGWVSTERNWHQDCYLSPPSVGERYAAVWMALEDIHPDAGPFEFVPGSHLWGEITRERAWAHLTPAERADPMWPKASERFMTEAAEAEIARRGAKVERFLGRRGDVLIWHSRLLHRGSAPKVPGMQRKALIAHYSYVGRPDFPPAVQHGDGGWFFPIAESGPVR
jgi:ectoine hydroxylase-related dioxygenase (phytanoyl-CoA dioxygenase family)